MMRGLKLYQANTLSKETHHLQEKASFFSHLPP